MLIGASLYFSIVNYSQLPAEIATHFNLAGDPDGVSGKWLVCALAGAQLFLYLLLSTVQRFPELHNYPIEITKANAAELHACSRGMILTLKLALNCIFTFLTIQTIRIGLGEARTLSAWFAFTAVGAAFAIVLFYLLRVFQIAKKYKN